MHGGSLWRINARTLFAFLLAVSAVVLYSCRQADPVVTETNPDKDPFVLSRSDAGPFSRLRRSESGADRVLCERLNGAIHESRNANGRWGLFVFDLGTGKIVCIREPRGLFIPASALKLVTAAVALERLGPGFVFRTSVYGDLGAVNGKLAGDLVLYGRGAPDLTSPDLKKLARKLKARGLRTVAGDIVGDESWFKGDTLGEGWTWNDIQWYYGARASALSIDQNTVRISLRDGKPYSSDRSLELSGHTEGDGGPEAVGVKRKLGTDRVFVWGTGRHLNARLAVRDPALSAARQLKASLEVVGIEVNGIARSAGWEKPELEDPEKETELASIESASLSMLVRRMNRRSDNLYAEVLLRTLGKKFGREAPDPDPKKQALRGDDSAGASVIRKWLRDKGVLAGDIVLRDGSGLSRLDYINPETLGRVLIHMAGAGSSRVFLDSLPVSGRSGTLKNRLSGYRGDFAAKTGTSTYVGSLAGYVRRRGGSLAFVIICNDPANEDAIQKSVDDVASLLAG